MYDQQHNISDSDTPRIRKRVFKGDPWLWSILVLLLLISVLVVYSSAASMAYRVDKGDTSVYLVRSIRFAAVCFIATWVTHYFNVNTFLRYGKLLLLIAIILLLWAYIRPYELNDATRSLKIGPFTIQPADAVKIALMFVMAQQLSIRRRFIHRIKIIPPLAFWNWKYYPAQVSHTIHKTSIPLLLPPAICCGLIMYSNLSTAMILFISVMVLMWIGRVRSREVWRIVGAAAVVIVVVVMFMWFLGVGRAETWVNRSVRHVASLCQIELPQQLAIEDDDFQLEQAKIAIASGGFRGKGPGNSTQRSQLPHPYSDFAYAFITEEYGIVGAVMIPVLYLLILVRVRKIVQATPYPSHKLLVMGLTLVMAISAFLHILVSVGAAPVTGQVLPLISLGGSAMLFNGISMGLILSVSRMTNSNRAREYLQRQLELQERLEQEKLDEIDNEPVETVDLEQQEYEQLEDENQLND